LVSAINYKKYISSSWSPSSCISFSKHHERTRYSRWADRWKYV